MVIYLFKRKFLFLFIFVIFIFFTFGCFSSKSDEDSLIETSYSEFLPIIEKYQIEKSFYEKIVTFDNFKKEHFLDYYLKYSTGFYHDNFIYLINSVNFPNFLKGNSYQETYQAIFSPVILVNKRFFLPKNFIPNSLKNIDIFTHIKRDYEVFASSIIFDNYQNLETFLFDLNLSPYIYSAYRSYDRQVELFNLSNDLSLVAKPGHSEHQTGLALDVASLESGLTVHFENTVLFLNLVSVAHENGFILRYPKGKEEITGFSYEPWHFRYVGKEIATIIYKENLTLEEYFYQYVPLNYA